MRDDRGRAYLTNCISYDWVYFANARYDKFLPNRYHTRSCGEVARVGFQGSEDIEKLPGSHEPTAGALDAAIVERVGDEGYGNTAAYQGASDGQQGIEVSLRTEARDYDIHLARSTFGRLASRPDTVILQWTIPVLLGVNIFRPSR